MRLTGTKRFALGLLAGSAVLLVAAAEGRAGGFSISFGGRSAYRGLTGRHGGQGYQQVRGVPRHSYVQRLGRRGRHGYVHRPARRVVIIRYVTPYRGRSRAHAVRSASHGSRVMFSPQPYYPGGRGGAVITNWLR